MLRKLYTSFFVFTLIVGGVQFSFPQITQGAVSVAAFSNAQYGELLVQYVGSDELEILTFSTNQEAALAMNELQGREDVRNVQPNFIYRLAAMPNDALVDSQTYLDVINAPQAWDLATSAKDVVIAVIDSGVDLDHPDLIDNIWVNTQEVVNGVDDDGNGFADDIHGWDFVTDSADPTPKFENNISENSVGVQHGTVVSGLIGAVGDNNQGISGVAWQTQIMALRVLDQSGVGNSGDVTRAIQYAIKNNADLINLSLVGTDHDTAVVLALKEAREKNIIVVAAAGNTNESLDVFPTYPVCYSEFGPATVIGVGAIDNSLNKASFSNYGNNCVDISAPGVSMFSTRLVNPDFSSRQQYAALFSGTSFATPLVTGTIALMKQVNPNLTADEALQYLQAGALQTKATSAGIELGLDVKGTLDVFFAAFGNGPSLREPSIPEFLVYPQEVLESVAYRYQLDGPLFISPIIIDQSVIAPGVSVARESGASVILSSWGYGRLDIVRHYTRSGITEKLFQLSVEEFGIKSIGDVAVGNVDFDDAKEIVVAAGPTSDPRIYIFREDGALKYQFAAFDKSIRGGLNVALIDKHNDGVLEIAVSPLMETSGHIKIFEYTGLMLSEWQAYADNFNGGANLSVADTDKDGTMEIIVGPGFSGGPHVKVFNFSGILKQEFFAGQVKDENGAKVEVFDIDDNGSKEFVITYVGEFLPVLRIYNLAGEFQRELGVLTPDYRGELTIVPL